MTGAGLYVHVPFCLTRCGYCDFNAYAGLDHLAGRYARALRAETDLAAGDWNGVTVASVFLGGGTPTTLPADGLVRLLDHLREAFVVAADAEVTVEANPDTVDEAYLRTLRRGGVNRLSMGVQSFDRGVLASLERIHSPASARRAYRAARDAGFDDVNLDLIYGTNGETDGSWEATLREAIALGPDHLSCYALTIEPATSLGRQVAAGAIAAPDPDVQAARYDLACRLLGAAGYEHYEVSNWARPGHRSVHNLGYWEGRPYLGLGAGAHSFRGDRRWWNLRPPQQYLAIVEAGRLPVGGDERLTEEDRNLERLLLGLRVATGVPAGWLDPDRVGDAVAAGLAERRNGHVAPTERGMFLASELATSLA